MNRVITMTRIPTTLDLDRLAPSTLKAIQLAQQEAVRMEAPEVYPEHLLLGVLKQGDDGVEQVLSNLGINMQAVRIGISTVLGSDGYNEPEESNWPLSVDALECMDWASSFAAYMHYAHVLPGHLLLGTLRHPSTHPLLVLLLSAYGPQTTPMISATGADYTSQMDQLIYSRIREQIVVFFNTGIPRRVLISFERPTLCFADIKGMDAAKQQLRQVIEYLRRPVVYERSERIDLFGVLLVGYSCTDRSLLVKATAAEAVVSLVTFSMATLVDMLSALYSGNMTIEDFELPRHEYKLLKESKVNQRGRNLIRHIFEHARAISPCMLFIDDLDALERLANAEERENCWRQLVVEMDRFDYSPPMVVIATVSRVDGLDRELLYPTRFSQQVSIGNGFMVDLAIQTRLCLACKHEGMIGWRYCVYCGATLAQQCPVCGAPSIQTEGERFCFQCGNPRTSEQ
jgi:ATPase family associated with various cellular activities (AAA)/Clp amino terminal domain, pathogenicity island component/Double zinc ribbon